MEEFATMIFENWLAEQQYDVDFFTEKGAELLDEAEKILSYDFVDKIYNVLGENGHEIMRRAFISGFGYACKCLSNGKIELKGRADYE